MNATNFTDGIQWEAETLEDYEFLFGPVNGPIMFVKAALEPVVGKMRVSSVDVENHTIYLEAANG